jgi:hypothetical protein
MARVQMVGQISGTRDGVDWPTPGAFLECTELEAADLIRSGLAKPAEKVSKVETADAPAVKVETATRKGLIRAEL